MKRRQFLMSAAAAAVANGLARGQVRAQASTIDVNSRTYHVLGVPFRAGSLLPGNENDAQAYRDAGMVAQLGSAGCKAVDDGDVAIPSYAHP